MVLERRRHPFCLKLWWWFRKEDFPSGTSGKEPTFQFRKHRDAFQSLGQEYPLEKEMATHSSILAWKILWTEELSGQWVSKSRTWLKRLRTQHTHIMPEGFTEGSVVKNSHAKQEMWVQSLGQEYPAENEKATHSGMLAWEIPWTEGPGGLQSTRSQSVRPNLVTESKEREIIPELTACKAHLQMRIFSSQQFLSFYDKNGTEKWDNSLEYKSLKLFISPLSLKYFVSEDLLSSLGNSAQSYMAAWMGGEFGREWTYMNDSVPLLSTWSKHNIVNQLDSNTK